jgi:hypothetical protein
VQAARGDTVTGTDAATGADVVIDGTWSCRRPHRRFPTRSGLSFRDPDNIALELFAPPGYVTRRVESACTWLALSPRSWRGRRGRRPAVRHP